MGGGSNRPSNQNFTRNSSLTSQITYYGPLPSPLPLPPPPPNNPSPTTALPPPKFAQTPLIGRAGVEGGGVRGGGGAGMVEGSEGRFDPSPPHLIHEYFLKSSKILFFSSKHKNASWASFLGPLLPFHEL